MDLDALGTDVVLTHDRLLVRGPAATWSRAALALLAVAWPAAAAVLLASFGPALITGAGALLLAPAALVFPVLTVVAFQPPPVVAGLTRWPVALCFGGLGAALALLF